MSPEIQLAGIHPRSEKLIELTRSYERAKTSWSQVEVQFEQETKELVKLQKSLGFRHISDGALGWQDQLRPISRSLKGVESGTRYSRWFDTNTFYQKPIVVGKISAGEIDPNDFLRTELLTGERSPKSLSLDHTPSLNFQKTNTTKIILTCCPTLQLPSARSSKDSGRRAFRSSNYPNPVWSISHTESFSETSRRLNSLSMQFAP